MSVTFRTYQPMPLFGADYHKLRAFLVKLNTPGFHYGRWDWMITHDYLDPAGLPKIGLWEQDGELAAVATYDCNMGEAFLLRDDAYRHLDEQMLRYAQEAFTKDSAFRVLIVDGDMSMQQAAADNGYFPTQDKECDAIYPLGSGEITYTLPEGFSITSMAQTYNLYKYGEVLWKGFNHEADGQGKFVQPAEDLPKWDLMFHRPNVNLDLKIAVVAPDGAFVSYCGMWYEPGTDTALVEPVATDPAYRKLGLGRAAVLEGVRRSFALGAKRAFVGSSQQFYYNIGFRPYATSTWWKRRG